MLVSGNCHDKTFTTFARYYKKHQEVGTTKGQEPGVRSTGRASLESTVLSQILNTEWPTQRAAYNRIRYDS